jgi:hypothetical protein
MTKINKLLIVGQGLAGTVFHFTLFQRGIHADIIDCDSPGKASSASAGIINPITGPKYNKSWNFDVLKNVFEPFYESLNSFLGTKVFNPMRMYRKLGDAQQVNRWVYQSEQEVNNACYGSFSFMGMMPPGRLGLKYTKHIVWIIGRFLCYIEKSFGQWDFSGERPSPMIILLSNEIGQYTMV